VIRGLAGDRAAMAAALAAALVAAAILLPFRASWPDTNVSLLLVVVVVAVAAIGSRLAGTLAAVRVAAWFGFLLTLPCYRLTPGPGSRLSAHARVTAVTLADQAGRGLVARVQALST
jgi:K+-sensing histidine kinase KdpD